MSYKTSRWYGKGKQAGKTEAWMNLEDGLAEDLERYPKYARDPGELVSLSQDGWEETDHFQIKYGRAISDDSYDKEGFDVDKYVDLKTEFWEGYLQGRKEIGKDIYAIAKELIDAKTVKSKAKYTASKICTKSKSHKAGPAGLGSVR